MSSIIGVLGTVEILALQSSLAAGFMALALIPSFRTIQLKIVRISRSSFWIIISTLFVFFVVWIFVFNFSNMKLVGLAEVYEQRFSASPTVGSSAYAMGILSGSIDPFLMAYALVHKRPMLFFLGAMGQVIIYSVLAQKFVMLSILYIPGFYYLLGASNFAKFPTTAPLWRIGILIAALLGFGIFLAALTMYDENDFVGHIRAIILMRLFALPGGLVAQYAAFFQENPITYFTHIGPLRALLGYPYANDVSVEVGRYLVYGGNGMNANANFFASDGVAGLWLVGPAVIGIMVGIFLKIIDKIVGDKDLALVTISLSSFAISLTESSFFTALITGGGLLLLIILYLHRSSFASRAVFAPSANLLIPLAKRWSVAKKSRHPSDWPN